MRRGAPRNTTSIRTTASYTQTWFDNTGALDWSAREVDYDAQGRMTQYAYKMDDGTETIWRFDPANTQAWHHTLQVYSPDGQLEQASMGMDDGSVIVT